MQAAAATKSRIHSRVTAKSAVEMANSRLTPLARLLGIRFVSVDTDRVVAEMMVREELCTLPTGLHGGAFMSLADNTGAVATMVNLPAGAKGTTTIESKTNFLGPAPVDATITATSTPLHRGRRTQVWERRIELDGRLLSLTVQTQLIL